MYAHIFLDIFYVFTNEKLYFDDNLDMPNFDKDYYKLSWQKQFNFFVLHIHLDSI